VRDVDVRHLGVPLVICCHVIDDVIVDPGPESTMETLLEELGDFEPAKILLTHIHLDHAGAAGALAQRWPDAEVWVHERGAKHMLDPSRLMASAARIYGDDMDRLWGAMHPVPEAQLKVLSGGERLGPWRVEYTPGHASHHVSYLHEPTGTALVGDVAGVRIADGPILPPTPPPDVDREAWHDSLRVVASWAPERIAITHFGTWTDVADHLGEMHAALDRWAEVSQRLDDDAYAAAIEAEMRERTSDASVAEAFTRAMPPKMLWAGWARYWDGREKAAAEEDRAGGST
jgi:glyoxylase-like metal-dependent hydrolase (beta-lactamase superfamily II)